jgi:4-azaleucine resistance transporter AzlC
MARSGRVAAMHRKDFVRGLRAGLPVTIGYLPMAVAFGIGARTAGIDFTATTGMSVFVFAGASQFMAAELVASGVHPASIVLATLVLNFRHFLMSTHLGRRLRPGRAASLAVGFVVTDETYVVGSLEPDLTPAFFLGLGLAAWSGWLAGTVIGAAAAQAIPDILARSMSVTLYAMFIALLVPAVSSRWQRGIVAALAALIAWAASRFLPFLGSGWRIVVAMLAASAIAVVLPQEEEEVGA